MLYVSICDCMRDLFVGYLLNSVIKRVMAQRSSPREKEERMWKRGGRPTEGAETRSGCNTSEQLIIPVRRSHQMLRCDTQREGG